MPYRALIDRPATVFDVPPPPRPRNPLWIIFASALAHVTVLGAVAMFHRDPPKPNWSVVRVMTAEARGGIDEPMTMQITGFHRARVPVAPVE
jgi:hypothetical protein